MKIQLKINVAMNALKYYLDGEWVFKREKFEELERQILPQDKGEFDLSMEVDIVEYCIKCLLGARQFILNEDNSTLPRARKMLKRLVQMVQ